jgi:hypothetical protein
VVTFNDGDYENVMEVKENDETRDLKKVGKKSTSTVTNLLIVLYIYNN